MRGVRYVTDEEGNRVAVLLDLEQWADVWEDFQDVLVAREREGEPSKSLASFDAELRKDGLIGD
ncbi:MAG: hypothetical protein DMF56_23510 [Acidobacteria bacterium]|nr:MAG: hypothetical protein DMF56_23510 [Acidobacteriota bacterium]